MDELVDDYSFGDGVEVVDVNKFHIEDEIFDMTSLGDIILLEQTSNKYSKEEATPTIDDDTKLQRLSLAYERLKIIPKILLEEWAPYVKILDISHNEFDNLNFLTNFKQLASLICDHNKINSKTTMPYLPKLELLWMNHCKITNFYPWSRMLQLSCPNLKYLSLMGNPVSPYYNGGGDLFDYLHYRLFLISLFPHLIHLDGTVVTEEERKKAEKIFRRPLMERLVSMTQQTLPENLRAYAGRISEFLYPTPDIFYSEQKHNVII